MITKGAGENKMQKILMSSEIENDLQEIFQLAFESLTNRHVK